MDPASILMCVNIPRGITEDILCELFCVAGPIQDVSISKSGRSCFIVYEFEEGVKTAKEIFKDITLYGRPLEMYDKDDIQLIHQEQEEESKNAPRENEYSNTPKHHRFDSDGYHPRSNQFHNYDAMTPNRRDLQNFRGGPNQHIFYPQTGGDYYNMNSSHRITPPENVRMPSKFDLFKSPYQQPVSRNVYDQRHGYHAGSDVSDYRNNRTPNSYQKRHSEFPSPTDPALNRTPNSYQKRHTKFPSIDTDESSDDSRKRSFTEFPNPYEHPPSNSPNFNRKRPNVPFIPTERNDDAGSRKQKSNHLRDDISDIYPVEEDVEQKYEEQVRRQFHNSPRKPYDDRSKHSRYKNAPSTSSDYVIKNKSREFDRSPYPRHDQKRQDRGSRQSNQNHKDYRNRHR